MFNQFEPNIKATITFLKLLSVKVNAASVNETLQNHPDWPSLLCISDSLSKWNIPNAAGKVEPGQIENLPIPFIAFTQNREFPLSVVTKVDDTTVEFYSKNYNKPVTQNKEDFLKSWGGIYLMAEPNAQSGEKDYELNKRKSFIHGLIPISFFIIAAALSFFTLFKTINNNAAAIFMSTTGIYLQYFILLAGVIVTSLLLWYEIDKNNPLLQKVCTRCIRH